MDNVLQDIIQSEEEALRIEEEAKKQAVEILSEARKKAAEILENSLLEGEAMAEDILKRARTEAAEEKSLQVNSKNNFNEQIRMKSQEKLDQAVGFIVGKVVNKSWQ